MKPEFLELQHPESDYSNYDIIHGLLQHDAYHLGQLVLLSKYEL